MEKLSAEVIELLEEKSLRYNTPEFIEGDPVQVPHRFSTRENVEISGLISALLAWGKRELILRSSHEFIARMGNDPHGFLMNMTGEDLEVFREFRYRTFNDQDAAFMVSGLKHIYRDHGGLSEVFRTGYQRSGNIKSAIGYFRNVFLRAPHLRRSEKHFAAPEAGSAAKRLNLFLRWMVRKDNAGVDFGIWEKIDPADLMIPLDVHSGMVARKLGLLQRKQDDWKAVEQLTAVLRRLDPADPVRYDYALFGMGLNKEI